MSDRRWSPTLQALLAKAKADTPSGAARAKMWASISTAVGGAAGASGHPHPHVYGGGPPSAASLEVMDAGANAIAGGSSAMKMLAIGTLLGGTAAVGLTLAMLHVGAAATASTKLSTGPSISFRPGSGIAGDLPSQSSIPAVSDGTSLRLTTPPSADLPSASPERRHVPTLDHAAFGGRAVGSAGAWSTPGGRNDAATMGVSPMHANRETVIPALGAAVESVRLPQDESADVPSAIDPSDSLIREASFLAKARAALLRGDARSALRKVRAARSLPVRQLVPEELSLEAQTLRALGRASEAVDVERTLRTKYPESALAK